MCDCVVRACKMKRITSLFPDAPRTKRSKQRVVRAKNVEARHKRDNMRKVEGL